MAHYNPYNSPPTPGLGNVGSYQVSGIPYVTGALDCSITDGVMLEFPFVTSWVVVSNTGEEDEFLKIGFSQEGVKGSYLYGSGSYILPTDQQTPRLELKLTSLFLSGSTSVSVIAGMTGIPARRINNSAVSPSGSNWSGSLAAVVDGNGNTYPY